MVKSILDSLGEVVSKVSKTLLEVVSEVLNAFDDILSEVIGGDDAGFLLFLDSARHGGEGLLNLLFNALVGVGAVAFLSNALGKGVGWGLKFEGSGASSDGGGSEKFALHVE